MLQFYDENQFSLLYHPVSSLRCHSCCFSLSLSGNSAYWIRFLLHWAPNFLTVLFSFSLPSPPPAFLFYFLKFPILSSNTFIAFSCYIHLISRTLFLLDTFFYYGNLFYFLNISLWSFLLFLAVFHFLWDLFFCFGLFCYGTAMFLKPGLQSLNFFF